MSLLYLRHGFSLTRMDFTPSVVGCGSVLSRRPSSLENPGTAEAVVTEPSRVSRYVADDHMVEQLNAALAQRPNPKGNSAASCRECLAFDVEGLAIVAAPST